MNQAVAVGHPLPNISAYATDQVVAHAPNYGYV